MVKSKEYEAESQDVEEEINHLKKNPIKLNLIKCDKFKMVIEFPVILFKCRHNYHALCLQSYSKDWKNPHCPLRFFYGKK